MPTGWTYAELTRRLPDRSAEFRLLPPPPYHGADRDGNRLGLAVASMKDHMTDEGHQLFQGLAHAGYGIAGHDCTIDETDVWKLVQQYHPSVVVLQDKREWEGLTADRSRDPKMRFTNVGVLADRPDIFTGTVLKDAQHNPEYHRESAREIGAHFWITYYHPDVVCHLAPWIRREHIVRTWHTVDADLVPAFDAWERRGCVLSGAILGGAYPVRRRLAQAVEQLPETTVLRHPGYHRKGCCTPEYLKALSRFKVSICTSSVYGYALRKLVESTACGCMVLTDLPEEETLPEIDDNLARINPAWPTIRIANILQEMLQNWDAERQRERAERALAFYDFRSEGVRLAERIERLRQIYGKEKA